jgi:hypothetical protein
MHILNFLLVNILFIKCIAFIDINSFAYSGSFSGTNFRYAISTNSGNTLFVSLLENGKEKICKYDVVFDTLVLQGQLLV